MTVTNNHQYLPQPFAAALLAGVRPGEWVRLVSAPLVPGGPPRAFDVLYAEYRQGSLRNGVYSYFTAGWSDFVKAHRLVFGEVVGFERGGEEAEAEDAPPPPGRRRRPSTRSGGGGGGGRDDARVKLIATITRTIGRGRGGR